MIQVPPSPRKSAALLRGSRPLASAHAGPELCGLACPACERAARIAAERDERRARRRNERRATRDEARRLARLLALHPQILAAALAPLKRDLAAVADAVARLEGRP